MSSGFESFEFQIIKIVIMHVVQMQNLHLKLRFFSLELHVVSLDSRIQAIVNQL